jgi:hypothetical protein
MTNEAEASIIVLAWVIIVSIFLVFGLVFSIVYALKGFLNDINKFIKTVTVLYEKEEEAHRNDQGGTGFRES